MLCTIAAFEAQREGSQKLLTSPCGRPGTPTSPARRFTNTVSNSVFSATHTHYSALVCGVVCGGVLHTCTGTYIYIHTWRPENSLTCSLVDVYTNIGDQVSHWPRIHQPPVSSPVQDHKDAAPCPAFHMGFWELNSSPRACKRALCQLSR